MNSATSSTLPGFAPIFTRSVLSALMLTVVLVSCPWSAWAASVFTLMVTGIEAVNHAASMAGNAVYALADQNLGASGTMWLFLALLFGFLASKEKAWTAGDVRRSQVAHDCITASLLFLTFSGVGLCMIAAFHAIRHWS